MSGRARRKVLTEMLRPLELDAAVISVEGLTRLVFALLYPSFALLYPSDAGTFPTAVASSVFEATVIRDGVRDTANLLVPGCVALFRSATFVSSGTLAPGAFPPGGVLSAGPVWEGVRLPPGWTAEDFAAAVAAAIRLDAASRTSSKAT